MLQLICDKCNAPIALDSLKPGDRVSCPACGDVNIVPGFGAAPPPDAPRALDRAAAAGFPPSDGPEVQVLVRRTAMFRAHPFRFLLLGVLFVAGLAGAVAFAWVIPRPTWTWAGCLIVAAVPFLWLAWWKLSTYDEGLVITTKRTIDREGFLRKHTSEVLHADIRNIEITQTFWQRVWNVGTIGISSAADNREEVFMEKVARPEEVRRVIDLYRGM